MTHRSGRHTGLTQALYSTGWLSLSSITSLMATPLRLRPYSGCLITLSTRMSFTRMNIFKSKSPCVNLVWGGACVLFTVDVTVPLDTDAPPPAILMYPTLTPGHGVVVVAFKPIPFYILSRVVKYISKGTWKAQHGNFHHVFTFFNLKPSLSM